MTMTDARLKNITLLILDVDGVLTPGEITYTGSDSESKTFHVKDGFGIRMLRDAGLMVGVITGRQSEALDRRAAELKLDFCYSGIGDKSALLAPILEQNGCLPENVAFMGDDLPDIAIMKSVEVGIAVADAHPEVIKSADIVTRQCGGKGAVREICERILKARDLWEEILQSWVQAAL